MKTKINAHSKNKELPTTLITTLATLALLFVPLITTAANGDVNSDDCIEAQDLQQIRNAYKDPASQPGNAADFNGDNVVDVKDFAVTMARWNVGCVQPSEITVFKKPTFEWVLPGTTPTASEILDPNSSDPNLRGVVINATAGEYESATLAVRSPQRDFKNASLRIGDLSPVDTTGAPIPEENIDLRIIKVWNQSGKFWNDGGQNPQQAAELILYDDRDDLSGSFVDGEFVPPSIDTKLRTTIRQNVTKNFYATVKIPEGTPPGTYEGELEIIHGLYTVQTIPFRVNVLNFQLDDSGKQYFMFYDPPYSINENTGFAEVDFEAVETYYDDIISHGFTGTRYLVTDFEDQFALAKEKGLTGPNIVYYGSDVNNNRMQTIWNAVNESGLDDVYYYPLDEPDNCFVRKDNPNKDPHRSIRHFMRRSLDFKNNVESTIENRTAVALARDETLDLLNDIAGNATAYQQVDPATENYRADGTSRTPPQGNSFIENQVSSAAPNLAMLQVDNLIGGNSDPGPSGCGNAQNPQAPAGQKNFWYWQAYTDVENVSRQMTGYFLYLSGRDGVAPFKYQFFQEEAGDPFDEETNNVRDAMITYPSAQGPIPTLKWEEMREGIDDMRYLATLVNKLNALENTKPQQVAIIRGNLQTELSKYADISDYDTLSPGDFDATRAKIIDWIGRLD